MKYGLIGEKLGHSFSKEIHERLGYDYELCEIAPEELDGFMKARNFVGINVTMPYKAAVIPYLDEIDDVASEIGAVNTIINRDGKLYGYNTDYYGMEKLFDHAEVDPYEKKVAVLGSGGTSKTAMAVLKSLGASEIICVSRSGEVSYDELYKSHSDVEIIVNTTPVGMYPHNGVSPINLEDFPLLEGVLDLIYNPERTKLLMDAQQRGLITENGLFMLVFQAQEASCYIANNVVSTAKADEVYHFLQKKMENIILIGMPGCGKSTIGQLLAKQCGKQFVDADSRIAEAAGKSIPKIFAEDGEDVFRAWETKVLEELGKQSGLVIATGGGCVTQERNYPLLHQNGRIIWIQRDLKKLPKQGRPLSLAGSVEEMYAVREHLYRHYADIIIENNDAVENTIKTIMEKLQ